MGSREYHLYRAKFIKPHQLPLLSPEKSPSDIFYEAINSKPNYSTTSGKEWHIGNIEVLFEKSGSFAVGKRIKTLVEKYDEETGDFQDQIDDTAPHTTVIFDCNIGLLGIAKKSNLAADPKMVAKKLTELFKVTSVVIDTAVDVKVEMIPDPESFIQKIQSAHSITMFKSTFTGPNPIDADEVFQKPLSVYAHKMAANTGSVIVKGEKLDVETVEAVAKSSASTSNQVTARIIVEKGEKPMQITFDNDAAVIFVDEDASKRDVLFEMLEQYKVIRE